MKPILFAFSMAFIFASCKKDIKLMDKRNDCKDCVVLIGTDFQGNIVTINQDFFYGNGMNQTPGDEYYNFTFCEYLEYARNDNNTVECN